MHDEAKRLLEAGILGRTVARVLAMEPWRVAAAQREVIDAMAKRRR